jgi:uncharacterized protein VirK/YbjX
LGHWVGVTVKVTNSGRNHIPRADQMVSSFWLRLWRDTHVIYGNGSRNLVRRIVVMSKALRLSRLLTGIYDDPGQSVLARLFSDRPEMIGILAWPYQCASWNVAERVAQLRNHCDLVEKLGAPFDIRTTYCAVLADLGFVREDMVVVLDQPKWFLREGMLVLNLFIGRVRMYSLAFSLTSDQSGLIATIGAMQGRNLESAPEEYRLLTKKTNGMRPRDFLFEIFRMMCNHIHVKKIFAVSNEDRHHIHPFFNKSLMQSSNYNEIWLERGGARKNHSFFELQPIAKRREIDNVSAKKRALYKRRYSMFDEINQCLAENLVNFKSQPCYMAAEDLNLSRVH